MIIHVGISYEYTIPIYTIISFTNLVTNENTMQGQTIGV